MPEVLKLLTQKLTHGSIFRGLSVFSEALSVCIMWLFTISALIGISLGFEDWFIPKTPLNLLIGLALLFINIPLMSKKSKALFLVAFTVGMVVEIVGVRTGMIFGNYEYGSNLGMKVFGVPLMIGIYWAVLVIVTSHMAKSFFKNIVSASITGSLLMVGLDFLMEQMAPSFDFWYFEGGFASVQNYTAWFFVALFLQIIAYSWMPKYKGSFATHLYFNQVTFFAISFIIYQIV